MTEQEKQFQSQLDLLPAEQTLIQPKSDVVCSPIEINEELTTTSEIKLIPKVWWFFFYSVTVALGQFHFGWAIFGNTQAAPVLIAKFEWDEDQSKLWNSLIGNSSLLGMLIGSCFGGGLIIGGRRRAIFMMNGLIYIGSSISLARTTPTILIGRFIQGFAAGILTMCTSKCIFETVPISHAGTFGCLTNIFISLSGFICLLLGNCLPNSPELYKEDEMWRLIYGFPMVWSTLQLILLLTLFRWDSLDFLISKGKNKEALEFLNILYDVPEGSEPKEEVLKKYLDIRMQNFVASKNTKIVTMKEALCSPDYVRSSWVCFVLGIFNQANGIGPVNIFCTIFLMKLQTITEGQFPITPKNGGFIVGATNLLFTLVGSVIAIKLGRKTLFLTGHVLMAISTILIGIFMITKQYEALFAFFLVFIASFQISQGNIGFLYFAEVCEGSAMGVVLAAVFSSMIISCFTFSYLIDSSIGIEGTFWMYAAINIIGAIYIAVVIKETKNLQIDQLQSLYLPKQRVRSVTTEMVKLPID